MRSQHGGARASLDMPFILVMTYQTLCAFISVSRMTGAVPMWLDHQKESQSTSASYRCEALRASTSGHTAPCDMQHGSERGETTPARSGLANLRPETIKSTGSFAPRHELVSTTSLDLRLDRSSVYHFRSPDSQSMIHDETSRESSSGLARKMGV